MVLPKTCYSSHGDLAETLRRYPRLFGFYMHHLSRGGIDRAQRSLMATPPTSDKSDASPPSLEPPFSPRASPEPRKCRDPAHERRRESPTEATLAPSFSPEEDWFPPTRAPNKPAQGIRRSRAVRYARRQHQALNPSPPDALQRKPAAYDLSALDRLLEHLARIIAACSDILRSDARDIPGHLPRCLTEPLTDLQVCLAAEDVSDFLLRPELVGACCSDDARAAHFRAMRILRLYVAPSRFHLVFSLMALVTAYAAISHLGGLVSSAAHGARMSTPASSRFPVRGRWSLSRDSRHDAQAKARSVLGLDANQSNFARSNDGFESPFMPEPSWTSPASTGCAGLAQQITPMQSLSLSTGRSHHDFSPRPVRMSQSGSSSPTTPYVARNNLALALIHRTRRFKRIEGDVEILVEFLARKTRISPFLVKKVMRATGFLPS